KTPVEFEKRMTRPFQCRLVPDHSKNSPDDTNGVPVRAMMTLWSWTELYQNSPPPTSQRRVITASIQPLKLVIALSPPPKSIPTAPSLRPAGQENWFWG